MRKRKDYDDVRPCDACNGGKHHTCEKRPMTAAERELVEAALAWRERRTEVSEGKLFHAACEVRAERERGGR